MDEQQRWYLAIGNYKWGRGHSVEEALASRKKVGGRGRRSEIKVIRLPVGADEPFVDNMGYARWTWAAGADQTGQVEVV